jgi:2-polyprenyl-3-methyl-5-hydroxy-6-metoxy-1,4-benzoquinol methylase
MTAITILIVNHHSFDFVKVSLYALSVLTKNRYEVKILDNSFGKDEYSNLLRLTRNNKNIKIFRKTSNKRGSQSHAEALDYLVKKVKTEYFSILDADAIWLKKDWDQMLIKKLGVKTKIIGSQAPQPKPQDFPLMFACVCETKAFRKLKISFQPKEIKSYQDTGHEMRNKYFSVGFKGENLMVKNTRYYKKGKFNQVICAEYYTRVKNRNELIASHFGRGSSFGMAKYLDFENSLISKIPVLKNILARRKGIIEKNNWIKICNEIIENEKVSQKISFENARCDYCGSKSVKPILKSKDYLNHLPGVFQIVQCEKCDLIFTSPRPKQSHIKHFYPKTTGYYIPEILLKKTGLKKIVNDVVLTLYFDYPFFVIPNFLKNILKTALFPIFIYPIFYLKYYGTPDYVKNGYLLDVGCSYGRYLLEMKRLGFEVEGIEMDQKSAVWGKRNFLVKITSQNFEIFFPKKKFDVITMRMFLEHSYSPMKALLKAAKLLNDFGELIITVPDYNGIEQLIYREYGHNLHLPVHLTHFTKNTICLYLKKCGFKHVKIYHSLFDRDLIAPLAFMEKNHKYVRNLNKILMNKIFRTILIKPLIIWVGIFGKTSRMTIYCQKK